MIHRYQQFSTAISCLYHDIQKLERVEMAKYGLKGPHAHCLQVMAGFPKGITSAQLTERCEKDKAAISRAVAELEEAIQEALDSGHGYVIDCAIDMDEMVRPMVPGGGQITDFLVC